MGACRDTGTPLLLTRTCMKFGLKAKDERLMACTPTQNCVSTSAVKSPSQFGAPWSYSPETANADRAFQSLVAAIKSSNDLKLVDFDESRRYVHATAQTVIQGARAQDVDDLEFVVSPEFCFYRSASRESAFFFPPQNIYSVPLGDGGTNRDRMNKLRERLGWETTGPRSGGDDDDPSKYKPLISK
mmetsp:Transcript_27089/g.93543  ORF Transcript_27089/g.93543 Transcript_27089/m.93543 type:complete len:186 (-) Transcript_27089:27-584(-)